jgi:hypothetical protein
MRVFEAIVTAVGPDAAACREARIDVGLLLGELGLVPERFTEWTFKFGADSLGASSTGQTLIPDFPAFSMLAWVDVDPVVIDPEQLNSLAEECSRLMQTTNSAGVSSQCSSLKALAECALTNQLSLRFDTV